MKKIILPLLIAASIVFLLGCTVPEPQGTLNINVVDMESRAPIQGASVEMNGTSFGLEYTDEQGNASAALAPGLYKVTVSKEGYETQTMQTTVQPNVTSSIQAEIEALEAKPSEPTPAEKTYSLGDIIGMTSKSGKSYYIKISAYHYADNSVDLNLMTQEGEIVSRVKNATEGNVSFYDGQGKDILERLVEITKIDSTNSEVTMRIEGATGEVINEQ